MTIYVDKPVWRREISKAPFIDEDRESIRIERERIRKSDLNTFPATEA